LKFLQKDRCHEVKLGETTGKRFSKENGSQNTTYYGERDQIEPIFELQFPDMKHIFEKEWTQDDKSEQMLKHDD